jgi:glycosyltransferase involved in cell wall biosynthesis
MDAQSVVHVTEPVDGGVARCVVDYVRDQVGRGWDVTVVSPPDAPFVQTVRELGARHIALAVRPRTAEDRPARPSVREVTSGGRLLRNLVRELKPDTVHLHSSWAGLAGRLALRGTTPTFFQPHGWSFDAVGGKLRRVARLWERLATRWATRILCVSELERVRGVAAGLDARWEVVPNGVPVEEPAATADDRTAARTALGLDGGVPVAACVGRLSPVKGQDLLLAAWPGVRATVPSAVLVLAGDGPDRAELEARAGAEVRFIGWPDDAAAVYDAADVVVIPSRSEGMSMAMLEAMARGRSIVSADVGGARDAIGTDAGAVVDASDQTAFAQEIAARLSDRSLAEREGAAARRRVEASYDVRQTAARVAELY